VTEENVILVEYRDSHAVITINRAEKRNAMSVAAQTGLIDAFDEIKKAGTKAVVLTSAGDQSFCAGVDIKEPQDRTQRIFAAEGNLWARVQRAVLNSPAVVIAAVNGYALGGGLTLVNASDLAVAVDTATFGQPEITFGAYPALAGPTTLRRVLQKHASWLTFTGQRIDAAKAESWGLINEVVPREQLLPRAEELAEHIAAFDALSLDYAKKAHHIVEDLGWDAGVDYGLTVQHVLASMKQVPR
jgi:enoyl-CoA hydratase/carnithine racemase